MPYLDIIFHNLQHGGTPVNGPLSRENYTSNFVREMNVFQSITPEGESWPGEIGEGMPPSASVEWGASITTRDTACGIFLCESHSYEHEDYNLWKEEGPGLTRSAIPDIEDHVNCGLVPIPPYPLDPNTLCAFLEGDIDEIEEDPEEKLIPLSPPSEYWFGSQALRCLGTGAEGLLGLKKAPYGSDRYGIYFQTQRWAFPNGKKIRGVFVHIKNTLADPGTQIVALCRRFKNEIIFGDMNLNLRNTFKCESLSYAIGETHKILAIKIASSPHLYYATRKYSCLDYALVPLDAFQYVELWAYRPPGATYSLFKNNSDHSVMMLRIKCQLNTLEPFYFD